MMSFSLIFFMALPLPLKLVAIILGGVAFTGVRVKHAEARAQALEEVAPRPEPRAVPAPVQPAPSKPVAPGVKQVKPLEITVNSDGSYQVNGNQLTETQLVKKLKKIAKTTPDRRVLIKADALTPHQMVGNAFKISKSAGLVNVSFASKPSAP